MSNTQSNDSLRELNAKLLAEIAELRKKFAEIKIKNDEVPKLKKKVAEDEVEKMKLRQELKARTNELKKTILHYSVVIGKLNAKIVELEKYKSAITKLESENAEFRVRFMKLEQQTQVSEAFEEVIPEVSAVDVPSLPKQTDQLNSEVGQVDTMPSDNANTESLEDKETDAFLDEVHKNKVSDEIRQRNRLLHESANQDSSATNIDRMILENSGEFEKTVPSGNDQSHVILKTEVSVEQDDDMIPEESLDENQIVEQGLIHELCSSISPEDNVSSTEIISSCVSLENLISGSAQHLSYLFETAIKSSQQEILDWYNYSFEFESKVDALMADGRIKDKTARSTIYKEMKPFLPTKITQANLRKKTHRARKHLMLFGKNGIGLDKIKLVSYSATEISKLTNAQIQNVIDQVKKYTSDHQSHMTLIKTVP